MNIKRFHIETETGKSVEFTLPDHWDYPMVTCLCSKCAEPFFSRSDRKIIRINPFQYKYDKCDICSDDKGHDYVIFEDTRLMAA